MPELHDLKPNPGSHRGGKKVGRGPGSGKGKTSGRGHKGQGARSGGQVRRGFEGGQMPLQRRIPKRGFTNLNRVVYQVVNVRDLSRIDAGEVTPEILREHGLIRTLSQPVKVLGMGEVDGSYQVSAHRFSGTARDKIESAGGTVTVLAGGDDSSAAAGDAPVAETRRKSAPRAEETEEASAPEGEGASEAEEEKA